MRWTSRSASFAMLAALPAVPCVACSISVAGVPFGAYDTFSPAPTTGAAQIAIECQRGNDRPEIALGSGNSGSYAARTLSGTSDLLQYNLYTSPTYTTVWGDGSGGTATVFPTETSNKSFRATIYGRIPPRQNVRAGTYNDTIFVTIVF